MILPDEVKREFLIHLVDVYEALEPFPANVEGDIYTIAYVTDTWATATWKAISWEHKVIPGAVYTHYKNVAKQIADTLNEEQPSIQG